MESAKKNTAVQAGISFRKKYNCAQSVLRGFLDTWEDERVSTPEKRELLEKAVIGLGGGMGHTGQICGAASGGILALSLLYGYEGEPDPSRKERLYARIEDYVNRFRGRYGGESCPGILNQGAIITGLTGENDRGQHRVCEDAVRFAGEELDRIRTAD